MNIVKTDSTDPLTQARELIAQEIKDREEKCFAETNLIYEKHDCELVITVQIAGQHVPVQSILNLPIGIMIKAKPR